MKFETIFDLMADRFEKAEVECILIGGFAINAYKVSRQTADLDFLATEQAYKKLKPLLISEGYREGPAAANFARLLGNGGRFFDVDFLFVDGETFSGIRKAAKNYKITGHLFLIPSVEHLIALKLHAIRNDPSRKRRDLGDVLELVRVQKLDVTRAGFKKLCLSYGTPGLYKEITLEGRRA